MLAIGLLSAIPPPTHPGRDLVVCPTLHSRLDRAGRTWYNDRVRTQKELAVLLPEELRRLFDTDQVYLAEGKSADKPVVRWRTGEHKGAFVTGTGGEIRVPSEDNGQRGGIRQTNEYRALLERYMTDDRFTWLIDQLFTAVEGGEIYQDCHACGTPVHMYRKPDTNAALKLMDQMMGKATEHKEIDIEMRSLHAEIEAKVDPGTLRINRVDPGEVRRRREHLAVEVEAEVLDD